MPAIPNGHQLGSWHFLLLEMQKSIVDRKLDKVAPWINDPPRWNFTTTQNLSFPHFYKCNFKTNACYDATYILFNIYRYDAIYDFGGRPIKSGIVKPKATCNTGFTTQSLPDIWDEKWGFSPGFLQADGSAGPGCRPTHTGRLWCQGGGSRRSC